MHWMYGQGQMIIWIQIFFLENKYKVKDIWSTCHDTFFYFFWVKSWGFALSGALSTWKVADTTTLNDHNDHKDNDGYVFTFRNQYMIIPF